MKIGIDASRAFQTERTGIEEYSYQVIKSLGNKLDNAQVVLYVRKTQSAKLKAQNFSLPSNWKYKIINFPILWTQIGLSLEMLFHPVDVLFVPAHVVPIIHPKNTVVTIHGLEYEFYPKAYSFWERLYMSWSIKNSCRWVKKIIAVSENTKKDLMKLYKVPEEKIKVVYEGYDVHNQDTRNKNQENSKYLLFIGRLEERKNILGIINAFEILKEKYKVPHKLLMAGKPGFGYEKINLRIRNLLEIINSKLEIVELGHVSDEKKLELYKNAELFLFPSFYEGFGLPILEAQSVGVPVVSSNVSSIPEVAGESALLVDPKKPEEIVEAVYKLISDQKLRQEIIRKGYDNVKRFSWDKCAEEIKNLLLS